MASSKCEAVAFSSSVPSFSVTVHPTSLSGSSTPGTKNLASFEVVHSNILQHKVLDCLISQAWGKSLSVMATGQKRPSFGLQVDNIPLAGRNATELDST
jgi:hypothetical protein